MGKKIKSITQKAKAKILSTTPSQMAASQARRRNIVHFAEKLGFVYFGFVDQRRDEHRLVRGVTLSPSHRDNHYCIGSYKGYDMVLVQRTDTVSFPGKPTRPYRWMILQIDLRRKTDLPHIFVGVNTHSDTFYLNLFSTFNRLRRVYLGMLGVHHADFTNRYNVYVEPARAIEAERVLTPGITQAIGQKFHPFDIEVDDSALYVYADKQAVSQQLLESMLKSGLWLAEAIDKQPEEPAS